MNPIAIVLLFGALTLVFFSSAVQRWDLLRVGRAENRFDRVGTRLRNVVEYALAQRKMHYYPLAGLAHQLIFLGFAVLLLRTLILWGRGVYAPFNAFFFAPWQPLGKVYDLLKDTFAILVIFGALAFVYFRLIKRTRRMTLSAEGLLILGIICTMMLADILYDGAMGALYAQWPGLGCLQSVGEYTGVCASVSTLIAPLGSPPSVAHVLSFHVFAPAGSIVSMLLGGLPTGALVALSHVGFWTHVTLVLVFLNLLPHSKHFHVITAIPNVFFSNLNPPGRLPMLVESSEKLMDLVGAATDKADPLQDAVGIARIQHVTWKAILDFYTCTECGRCSDNCPAHRTGKILSPKQFTLDLRNHLYNNESKLVSAYGYTHDENSKSVIKEASSGPHEGEPVLLTLPDDASDTTHMPGGGGDSNPHTCLSTLSLRLSIRMCCGRVRRAAPVRSNVR